MKHIAIATVALAAFLASCQQSATLVDDGRGDFEEVWVTMGEDTLDEVERQLPGAVLDARETNDGVRVVKVWNTQLTELSHLMHDEFKRCGGFMTHDSYKTALLALDNQHARSAMLKAFAGYTIDNGEVAETMMNAVDEFKIEDTIVPLSSFPTRYYTSQSGIDAPLWIRDLWTSYTEGRSDVTVELFQHGGFPQASVIMTIQGDTMPDEVVVIGGHLDSIAGFGGGSSAPGADDDASGIATISEVIRVAMENDYKPDRTVKFMAYAAEEVGLRGSRDIANSFQAQNINVVGVLQLDMTNYKGSTQDIVLITDHTNAEQNDFVSQLIDTYLGISWTTDRCGYACSDHASWTAAGFPASLPFEARLSQSNPNIHTTNDTLEAMGGDAQHARKFARLATTYLAELAKGDLDGDGGGEPPPPPPPPPDPITENFSGSVVQGQSQHYGPFAVVAGTNFTAQLAGTGDGDLYVRYDAAPTADEYDCRPFKGGSSESCALTVPASATEVYVMVHGFANATFDLSVTYTPDGDGPGPGPGPDPDPKPVTETFSDSVSQGDEQRYAAFVVTPGTPFTAEIGGTGDADLYVHFGAPPTRSTYTCRPYENGSSETCTVTVPNGQTQAHVMIHGYRDATYDLAVTYTPGDDSGGGPGDTIERTESFDGGVAQSVMDEYGPFTVVAGSSVSAVLTPRNGTAGDADLYLRFGQAPTTGSYDCRPYLTGSSESCNVGVPGEQTQVYVSVRGYTAAEYQVEVTYTTPAE